MAVSGTGTLEVLTAVNLIDAVQNEPIIWNYYLEAVEEDKELAWPRIASIFGLKWFVHVIIFRTNEQVVANFLVTSC